MRARRLGAALVAAVAVGLGASATADASASSNWAGYAIHRAGVSFATVSGEWTVPDATCTAGRATYSSVWVGIGGYSLGSRALEQAGTELDCTSAGRVTASAWYELVPAASHTTRLTVRPGDRMRASVAVAGHNVTVRVADLTRGESFVRRMHAGTVDTSSAEWILEAPSSCIRSDSCRPLPLADFGSAAITGARATTTRGRSGSIADRRWATSRIDLVENARRFVAGTSSGTIRAVPSALTAGGRAFTITYAG